MLRVASAVVILAGIVLMAWGLSQGLSAHQAKQEKLDHSRWYTARVSLSIYADKYGDDIPDEEMIAYRLAADVANEYEQRYPEWKTEVVPHFPIRETRHP